MQVFQPNKKMSAQSLNKYRVGYGTNQRIEWEYPCKSQMTKEQPITSVSRYTYSPVARQFWLYYQYFGSCLLFALHESARFTFMLYVSPHLVHLFSLFIFMISISLTSFSCSFCRYLSYSSFLISKWCDRYFQLWTMLTLQTASSSWWPCCPKYKTGLLLALKPRRCFRTAFGTSWDCAWGRNYSGGHWLTWDGWVPRSAATIWSLSPPFFTT